jgi:hypothetical protein
MFNVFKGRIWAPLRSATQTRPARLDERSSATAYPSQLPGHRTGAGSLEISDPVARPPANVVRLEPDAVHQIGSHAYGCARAQELRTSGTQAPRLGTQTPAQLGLSGQSLVLFTTRAMGRFSQLLPVSFGLINNQIVKNFW